MTPSYGIDVALRASPAQAESWVRDALTAEGFGVLTEIDVRATLRQKLDVEFAPYRILGACNPVLAHRALLADPDAGLLLPCNIVIHQTPDATRVVALDPVAQLGVSGNAELFPIAEEARARLRRVVEAVARRAPLTPAEAI